MGKSKSAAIAGGLTFLLTILLWLIVRAGNPPILPVRSAAPAKPRLTRRPTLRRRYKRTR
jgi:hypothetical protein